MILKRLASVAAVLVLVTGPALAGDLAKTIRGKWKTDMVATLKASEMYQKMPAKAQEEMVKQMGDAPAFLFEFTADTIVATAGDAPPDTAHYKILKSDARTLALEVVSKKQDGTEAREDTSVELLDADSLKISKKGDEGKALILHRVK